MPTERPQQAHLFWLVSALAVFLIVAWQPAFGVAFLVGLALGALALALAHDYCAVALPGWGWPRRAALVLTCGALGVAAFLVWPVAPLPPAAALLALVITYQWQRGRWPNAVDRLTGLPTAAAFAARGEEELARGLRFGRPAVVAVVALDNANEVLALHGRDSLDRALRRVADLLRQHSRGYDLLGRLDDARFALLLPETNGDEAAAVVERLRAAIGQLQSAPADGGATIRLAASVGLAIHPRGGDTVRALVHRADSIARGLDGASDAAGTGANGRAAAPPWHEWWPRARGRARPPPRTGPWRAQREAVPSRGPRGRGAPG